MFAGVPGVKPVHIELTDFKTKEKVDELEVDAVMVATGRAPFTQVCRCTLELSLAMRFSGITCNAGSIAIHLDQCR